MSRSRSALVVALATAAGSLALSGVSAAAVARFQMAPGRVVIPVDGGTVVASDNAGGAGYPAVALPDGGAVLLYVGEYGQAEVVQITANGALDPSFGRAGIVGLGSGAPQFSAEQIVRQADGKLVIVGSQPSPNSLLRPASLLIRLNADGSLDRSFGSSGVASPPIQAASLAIRPGGGFVLNGGLTQGVGAGGTEISEWVVEALTPSGALDPAFGQSGVVTIARDGASGADVAALANGDTVLLGMEGTNSAPYRFELGRLLASGAPDPTFDGGALQTLPAGPIAAELLAYPDGAVLVGVEHAIIRYTTAGLPDQTFGSGAVVQTGPSGLPYQGGQLFPAAGDGALLIERTGREYGEGRYRAELIGPTGAIDTSLGGPTGLAFSIRFGGGSSNELDPVLPPVDLGLASNTFAGNVVQRPDGSYLFLGGVTVSQPTGEGTGFSIAEFAAAALTSSFKVDDSFGGPLTRLRATVTIARQRAATARTRHGIRVRLNLSAGGLARVVIKAHGRVVAQNVLPVFGPGAATLPVALSAYGNQLLRSHRGVKVTATVTGRDLLTNTATSTASGTLR